MLRNPSDPPNCLSKGTVETSYIYRDFTLLVNRPILIQRWNEMGTVAAYAAVMPHGIHRTAQNVVVSKRKKR